MLFYYMVQDFLIQQPLISCENSFPSQHFHVGDQNSCPPSIPLLSFEKFINEVSPLRGIKQPLSVMLVQAPFYWRDTDL